MNGDIHVIVGTIAFGMGINKPNIRWVVVYASPLPHRVILLEMGRAGRYVLPSRCVMFHSAADLHVHRSPRSKEEDKDEKKSTRSTPSPENPSPLPETTTPHLSTRTSQSPSTSTPRWTRRPSRLRLATPTSFFS